MDKILTICIPTYNRADKVRNLLSFLKNELDSIDDTNEICILVRNNNSTDNTEEVVLESSLFKETMYDTLYYKNSENLGLLGNLEKLYKEASGEYLWIMGDDDLYQKGIVKRVYEECRCNTYDYIFLNHSISKSNTFLTKSVLSDIDTKKTDKTVLWELYKKSGTVMMLLSACVYRNTLVKDYLKRYDVDLVIPCSLSFYCAANGRTKFIEEPLITNDQTDISWKKSQVKVFYYLIPSMLLRMLSWGYDRKECIKAYSRIKKKYLTMCVRQIKEKIEDLFIGRSK